MTLSIAFHRELALFFSAVVTMIVVVATGQGLSEFMILYRPVASAILLVGSIRNRRKLIYVGLAVGVVAALTTDRRRNARPRSRSTTIWPEAVRYRAVVGVRRLLDARPAAVHRKPVRRADRAEPAGTGRRRPSAAARTRPARTGHVQPLDQRRLDRRGRGREHRGQGAAGARGGLLPRYRQDAQARLLRREPGARCQPPRVARAGHEHADHHRPHQGRRRPGPAASAAQADHRLHRAASRHDAGRVFLRRPQRAKPAPTAARSTRATSAIPAPSRRPRKPPC